MSLKNLCHRQLLGGFLTFCLLAATALTGACAPAADNAQVDAAQPQPTAVEAAPAPQAAAPQPKPQPAKPAPAPVRPKPPATASLAGGSSFEVMLLEELSSDVALAGDAVAGRVVNPVRADGRIVIPAGAEVSGVVAEAKSAKRFGGQAVVVVAWNSVALPGGGSLAVEGQLIAEAKGTTKKDTAIITGSTAGGALLGKVLGGDSKDAAIGAVLGGGIGTAVASKRGDEAILLAETTGTVVTLAPAELRLQ